MQEIQRINRKASDFSQQKEWNNMQKNVINQSIQSMWCFLGCLLKVPFHLPQIFVDLIVVDLLVDVIISKRHNLDSLTMKVVIKSFA